LLFALNLRGYWNWRNTNPNHMRRRRIALKPVPLSCLVYASLLARHERIELFPTALAF
jgi:hypothetical protein